MKKKEKPELEDLGTVWFEARNCRTKLAAVAEPSEEAIAAYRDLAAAVNNAVNEITAKRKVFLATITEEANA